MPLGKLLMDETGIGDGPKLDQSDLRVEPVRDKLQAGIDCPLSSEKYRKDANKKMNEAISRRQGKIHIRVAIYSPSS